MKFLFLCPRHGKACELNYASCVAVKYVAPSISKMGHDVRVVLDPSPKEANENISEFKPDVVWWVGHGNKSVTTLQDVKFWIGDAEHCDNVNYTGNREVLKGTIADAHSCYTACCLGKSLTERYGCRYYLGYVDKFLFMWCGCEKSCACGYSNPTTCRDVVLTYCMIAPHDANLYFVIGLAKGMSPEKAYGYCLNRFNQWIDVLSRINPINPEEAAMLAAAVHVMKYDASIVRLCKNGQYVKAEKAEKPPSIPVPGMAVVEVNTYPENAKITINGKFVGYSPVTKDVVPGTVVITASKEGYETVSTTLHVKANKTYRVNITLHPPPTAVHAAAAGPVAIVALSVLPLVMMVGGKHV